MKTLAFALVYVLVGSGLASAQESPEARPNILLIITDDEAVGSEIATPNIRSWFENNGTIFTNAYATTPLCCPSRASILSGQYAHNHKVKRNSLARRFDHQTAFTRLLKEQGYQIGWFGKYLNGWRERKRPPNTDVWDTVIRQADHLEKAHAFIEQASAPWLAVASVRQPHKPYPTTPAYENMEFAWDPPPSVTSSSKKQGKPRYVRKPFRRQRASQRKGAILRTKQLRSLRSVDDQWQALTENVDLTDTLVIYISDNGYLWGDYGLWKKNFPYQPSVRVPLYAKVPGLTKGTDDRLVANIDIAPTLYDVLGMQPGYQLDGRSLLSSDRDMLLLEAFGQGGKKGERLRLREIQRTGRVPPWRSIVTFTHQYIETRKVGGWKKEFYDLEADPHQLRKIREGRDFYRRLLREVKGCRGVECP